MDALADMEPGVISKEMIEKSYLSYGYDGEALRLHQMEPIRYEMVTVLKLEFLNILRIDHLWMMPNLTKLGLNCNKIEVIENIGMLTSLKELNLSFNFIEKIENLETLKNLEVLSLFNNLITVIEGFDTLENLVIFSLGNNKIESLKGLERIRFLKKLNFFNMEGNPVCNMVGYPLATYIAGLLPNVKYYEYVYIDDELRKRGQEQFLRELREIETAEEEEIDFRNHRAKELEGELRFSSSFVEYLNEHQLFESLWQDNDFGRSLIEIGGKAIDDLLTEYRSDFFGITQVIFNLGLNKFEERKQEIELFTNSINQGQLSMQLSGHKVIEDFLPVKEAILKDITTCLNELKTQSAQSENTNFLMEKYVKMLSNFDEKSHSVWQMLMDDELHLYESVMESTSFFERNIQEMMTKFVELAQIYFAQLRDVAGHFAENLMDIVQKFIGLKLATKMTDGIPEKIKTVLEDNGAIRSIVDGMRDHHVRKIDEREDRLIRRSKKFVEELIDDLEKTELDRNRAKILEINDFMEIMTKNLPSLRSEIIKNSTD